MLAENLPFGGMGDPTTRARLQTRTQASARAHTRAHAGIGESGFGSYRGEWGFRLFTHERAVMEFDASDFNPARVPTSQ